MLSQTLINILLLCFSTCCTYYITICILFTINHCNIKLENHVYCVFDVFIESKLLVLVGPIQKRMMLLICKGMFWHL